MKNISKGCKKDNITLLILVIILTEAGGFLSAKLSRANMNTYESIIKPSFSPTSWIFPIVWIILYFLMAVAFYRILIKKQQGYNIKKAVIYYLIQLLLNFIWPIIFFRFKLYGIAFVELIILLVFVILTTFEFYKIDDVAAYLMIPYIIWLCFAGVLNMSIKVINTQLNFKGVE